MLTNPITYTYYYPTHALIQKHVKKEIVLILEAMQTL